MKLKEAKMPKIYRYKKVVDEFTTYSLVEPDYNLLETDSKITELCNLEGETYVSVPDDITLPEQPEQIVLSEIILTDGLKEQIKKTSVHVQLINQRVRDRIAEQYSEADEIKALRKENVDKVAFDKYNAFVNGCCLWGYGEKAKLGLEDEIIELTDVVE